MIYTPLALQAFGHAAAAARGLGQNCVSSQHLVLGLLEMRTGVAVQILQTLGLSRDTVVRLLIGYPGEEESSRIAETIPLGSSAAAALERAKHGGQRLGHAYVGTEHVLMSLLSETRGGTSEVFAAHGVDTEMTRRNLIAACSWSLAENHSREG